MKKPLIIAGNGPSIKDLDYSLFPKDFEVFRCNQFYFEDKYYLGREIKGVFFNPCVLSSQMQTAQYLMDNGEYSIERFFCSVSTDRHDFDGDYQTILPVEGYLKAHYPFVCDTFSLFKGHEEILRHVKYHLKTYSKELSAGVLMLLSAVVLGYKEIYLVGIDFGASSWGHFYDESQSQHFSNHMADCHNIYYDMFTICLCQKYAKLYALAPNSPLRHILALNPQAKYHFELLDKPIGYTSDLIVSLPLEEKLLEFKNIEEKLLEFKNIEEKLLEFKNIEEKLLEFKNIEEKLLEFKNIEEKLLEFKNIEEKLLVNRLKNILRKIKRKILPFFWGGGGNTHLKVSFRWGVA
ncbi:alpha-2,3-sialyltransferase [Helicobacter pylori]|uniref:alpha-2,3-sialyltransferase n=1 Tax=Helicobacter pylori TaxID=210 RepID=UPI0001E588A1|nr:alpha-2,3-sialyltransferase [Helicobacter pylori]ADO05253.1 bifunctional alpha-2,3/-2,8-sialyltransferase [Helicobacter pylori Sat464]